MLGAVMFFLLLLDETSLSLSGVSDPSARNEISRSATFSLSLSLLVAEVCGFAKKKKKKLIVSSVVTTSCRSSWTACAVVISQMAESHLLLSAMCISECVKTRHSTQLREGAVRCHSGQTQSPHHPLVD